MRIVAIFIANVIFSWTGFLAAQTIKDPVYIIPHDLVEIHSGTERVFALPREYVVARKDARSQRIETYLSFASDLFRAFEFSRKSEQLFVNRGTTERAIYHEQSRRILQQIVDPMIQILHVTTPDESFSINPTPTQRLAMSHAVVRILYALITANTTLTPTEATNTLMRWRLLLLMNAKELPSGTSPSEKGGMLWAVKQLTFALNYLERSHEDIFERTRDARGEMLQAVLDLKKKRNKQASMVYAIDEWLIPTLGASGDCEFRFISGK